MLTNRFWGYTSSLSKLALFLYLWFDIYKRPSFTYSTIFEYQLKIHVSIVAYLIISIKEC